ncbi:MAG TPA: hypothetical protein VKU00_05945 [Chthonomonadaceae bacterium]|nr:hypothetical protein [Chthonomonadaceae bacterium]
MAFSRQINAWCGALALGLWGLCAPRNANADDNLPTTPLPPTTTQERLVNPVGLTETSPLGWHTDFLGTGRGVFDLSFGIKFWPDRFYFRNVTFGSTVELLPGLRARLGFRRHEGEQQAFQVDTDEIYLEGFDQYRAPSWQGSFSLRAGHVRYLHTPYPDAIAQFDQVPGITDLTDGPETDFRNVVLSAEAALNSGWGVHFSGRAVALDGPPLARVLEAYGFYRHDFGRGWHFESRLGELAVRQEPLGRAAQFGGDVFLGKQLGEFNVGLLYEKKQTEHEYTGIMLQFRPGPVTRALGKIGLDYSRFPQEGFSAQIPVLHLRFNEQTTVRSGDILVGEVRAVRIRTLWRQGFLRNEYEHRLESWGETSDSHLRCVVTEEPWYLQTEALISPHIVPDARWEHDRQGPGQFVQRVTYRYYRPKPRKNDNGA